MRPRYRVWDKEEKKMVYNAEATYDNYPVNISSFGAILDCPSLYGVMQYTGLKDKNGKEIYEGDIVILNDAEEENRCVVKHKYGSYILVDGDLRENLSNVEDKFLEVVGNIYENKNLLEENKWNMC